MIRCFLVSLLVLFQLQNFAHAGPIIVGQGAGESEYSLIFSQLHLFDLLEDCKKVSCSLTKSEQTLAEWFQTKSKNRLQAVFKASGPSTSALYVLHPEQNEVWFNVDLLWLDSQKTTPYDVARAGSLWLDVLSAGESISVSDLKSLQTKLVLSLQQNIQRSASAYTPTETFEILLWKKAPTDSDALFVRDSTLQTLEISNNVRAAIQCSSKIQALKFYTPTFVSATPGANNEVLIYLSVNLKWTCGDESENSTAAVTVRAEKNTDNVLEFMPDSMIITIEDGKSL